MTLETEVQSLRQVPMFRDIDPARLKLLAFTSERVQFAEGQRFFVQGDAADAAYVILEGKADVTLNTPTGEIKVAELGRNALVGEMGILSDNPRSATVASAAVMVADLGLSDRMPISPTRALRPSSATLISPVGVLSVTLALPSRIT